MNYKEILFFIAKCLTISLEEKNRNEIEIILKTTQIDWDTVVKVSTAHYVFPAIYCNLKRADFLKYLPQELVCYMQYITNLNRERNQQIIAQAKELNKLLLGNNIRPIFLKGTGNLLAGIYEDIGERMVGDIDIISSKEDFSKAIEILKEFGYYTKVPSISTPRHYARLIKKGCIAAIENHNGLLSKKKYTKEFNYSFIEKDTQIKNRINILSYTNKLNLSIIANQINDHGFYYKRMALRNAYDVFLLSKKTNAKDAVNSFDKLSYPLNCFLAACYIVFNKVDSLEYNKTTEAVLYLRDFNSQFVNPITPKIKHKLINIYQFIREKLIIILKCVIHKEYRVWLFNLLTDNNWYKRKLVQFGINCKITK